MNESVPLNVDMFGSLTMTKEETNKFALDCLKRLTDTVENWPRNSMASFKGTLPCFMPPDAMCSSDSYNSTNFWTFVQSPPYDHVFHDSNSKYDIVKMVWE